MHEDDEDGVIEEIRYDTIRYDTIRESKDPCAPSSVVILGERT